MEIIASLVPMLIVFVVFYLVLLLPEKKRKKQYMQMLDKNGDNSIISTYVNSICSILFSTTITRKEEKKAIYANVR